MFSSSALQACRWRVPSCTAISPGDGLQHEGKLRGAEPQPWGAALPCGRFGVHKARHACIPHTQLLRTHTPIYHTDQLSCRLFALQQYPRALVQIETAPVSELSFAE